MKFKKYGDNMKKILLLAITFSITNAYLVMKIVKTNLEKVMIV